MKPVYTISVPEYALNKKIDYTEAGKLIDAKIAEHFLGKKVALRYLSLQDHKGVTADELIKTISDTGTDKHDPERNMSVSHDFYINKGVEIFAVSANVTPELDVTAEALRDFSEGAIKDRGYSLKIDLIVVYDLNQLECIPIQYDDGVGEDAFKFKYFNKKKDAVLGLLRIDS